MKKGIIFSLLGIVIVSVLLVVLVNNKEQKYIMQDGIMLAMTLDGENITSIPTETNYHVNIDCENATGVWMPEEWNLFVGDITGKVKCNIDFITKTDEHKIANIVQNSGTTISSTDNAGNTDVSYRYTGKNPDNYVWFNNELWRIIGLIPTCTSSGCTTEENLVKIIRNDSIGGFAYDASSTTSSSLQGAWGSNTLYKLLNEYYYGKKDGTESGYCYGYYNSSYKPIVGCDYTKSGISNLSTDYYGRMIKNVYWNTGASTKSATASAVYTTETATQSVSGYIGLMAASDFGYAASTTYHSTSMNSYVSAVATDWLYGEGYEWTSVQSSNNSYSALNVFLSGVLASNLAINGYAARPVVYLDSSVYIISGEGTEDNPYILGME